MTYSFAHLQREVDDRRSVESVGDVFIQVVRNERKPWKIKRVFRHVEPINSRPSGAVVSSWFPGAKSIFRSGTARYFFIIATLEAAEVALE